MTYQFVSKIVAIVIVPVVVLGNHAYGEPLVPGMPDPDLIRMQSQIDMMQTEMIMRQGQSNSYRTPDAKIKIFGKANNKVTYGIFTDTIKPHKSGRGIYFVEYSESKFPRHEGVYSFFYSHTGIVIDCKTNEYRFTGRVFFNSSEQYLGSEKYTSQFEQIPSNTISLYHRYKTFVCH